MSTSTQAPTREAALTLLLRQKAATAAELSELLEVSVQVMRRHLRSLEEEGLVEASASSEGPGRPTNQWRLTTAGRDQFPDGGEQFALGLLHSMAASLPPEMVKNLLRQQAMTKGSCDRQEIGEGSLTERLERLVELRRQEGYMSEFSADGDGLSWCMSEYRCSVGRLAEQFPQICDQELQQIRHTFPDCSIERVHWRLEGGHSCGFRLTPKGGRASEPVHQD
ncbi:iron-sulfur cluster biosynthesis transcriptional regulator SufR [Synechococcus sp. CS-602]|uniref:iron-sulfur cluster biosynthesis transcriptional regulator SufR n=1 Tax=Synechococcaceae TaxID=1890426 RepID=UPI0008FF29CB|nr:MULTISPECIES: iron-sulfur cluster biosynthesis transcriptional regulator SufR [Synechococcaceae]MCT4363971.1 iron-sulfur cluster biosynthesis transcriptional regulator SufR [Candidatus Regnicoccus frigidus MAG-AL1]APD48417.1 iron-sulfur cluster biosynthesis transcriptional regulator SufR [Synechococcus sp. SynAce01]MCT0201311.1 iron-sulfur cluster biosynthesis transcriptional regulator SufR [Synechococcus sp. CS-603]MCT0205861.1 iron-sulfur cluster biosynthesis transcriptional regulator SufR